MSLALVTASLPTLANHIQRPSFMEMVQPLSASREEENARAGRFRDKATGESFTQLACRILVGTETRVLWPEKIGLPRSQQFACRSQNGETPDLLRVAKPQAATCGECQYSQWLNGRRPLCNQRLLLLLHHPKTDKFHFISIGGLSIGRKGRPDRGEPPTGYYKLMSALATDALKRKEADPKIVLNVHDYIVTFKTEKDGFKNYRADPVKLTLRPVDEGLRARFDEVLAQNLSYLKGDAS